MNKYRKVILVAVLVIHLFLLSKLKFTAWPEMLLWPFLMIKGWLPYRDIAIAHTPLMLSILAIFYKFAGVGVLQLKVFTWILILATDLLLYFIVQKLWTLNKAIIALLIFVVLQIFFNGNGLWFDLFVSIFALAAFYFSERKKYFWTGIFWALAFISKQTAIWFLLPIGFSIFIKQKGKNKNLRSFIIGSSVIIGLFLLALAIFHILSDFYVWAIKFGLFVLPRAVGQIQLPDIKSLIVSAFPFLVFIPLIWRSKTKSITLFFWALAGSLGAYPRFEFFHFQPGLAYLAIATMLVFSETEKYNLFKYFIAFYLFGNLYLFANFFIRNYEEGVRFYEQDVQDVVSYVKSNTIPNDKIFILNWWDNIYALSDRLPAVDPWVPQLSWYMDIPGIQEKMTSDLSVSKPKLIIFNNYTGTGLSAYVPTKVYNYVTENYKPKEKIDNLEILAPK